jgi:outer membrane protein TolC
VGIGLLVGCQSYEPAPLDIGAYRASLDQRLSETEPVEAFSRRLHAGGEEVPERFDLSDGISHAEGEVLALFYNPQLRLVRAEAGVALANKETAGLWEDPVFGFDGAEILSPSSPFEFGLMGSLTIPISGRLEVEKAQAGAAYEAELRTLVDAEWQVRADVRRLWSAWTAAGMQAELLAKIIDDLQHINRIAEQLEAAGELNRIEGRLLRIELAGRHVQVSEKELAVITAEMDLLELLGLPPNAAELLRPAYFNVSSPPRHDVTARLIDCNTELAVQFANYDTAEETLRLEVKKQFPDIVIGSGYGTEFNDHRVMFGLSIPVPILNANRAGIAEAGAAREVARARAETTFARLLRQLAGANATLELKRAQRSRYELEVVPMLAEQTKDIHAIAELGELDIFVLLETMTRTLGAKQSLIDLQLGEINAAITVARILGPDTRRAPTPRHDQTAATADSGETP